MAHDTRIDDSWYVRPAGVPEHVSAGGVVVRADGDAVLVALALEEDFPAYVLPKGHQEPGESLVAAARREVAEEAGLDELELLGELGSRGRLNFSRAQWKTTHYFLFLTEQLAGQPTDPRHPRGARWFALDDLPEMFWPEQRVLLEDTRETIRALVAEALSQSDRRRR